MIRIVLFGDTSGVPQLLKHLPEESVVGIVGACIRPQYLDDLSCLADGRGVPFLVQPKWNSAEYDDFKAQLSELCADLVWVNSYSMIIRDDVLALARLGGLNIHSALLPRNRGCNPTQWAILNGEVVTGVTLHELTNGIDQGPVVDQKEVPIRLGDTWIDVRDRLSSATEVLLETNMDRILLGRWTSVPQTESQATVGARRTPQDGEFSWEDPVIDIYNKIRALLPPLPPAFYRDSDGDEHKVTNFQTISHVTTQKFNRANPRISMTGAVRLLPVSETEDEIDSVTFEIVDATTAKHLGRAEVTGMDWQRRSAYIKIDFSEMGDGYREDAARAVTAYAIEELKLDRVQVLGVDVE